MGEGAEGELFPQGELWRTSQVLTVSSVRNRAFLKLFVSQKHKAHSFFINFFYQSDILYMCNSQVGQYDSSFNQSQSAI